MAKENERTVTGMDEYKDCIHFEVCAYASHDLPACDCFAAEMAQVVHGRWVIVDDGVMIGDGKHMECGVCHTWSKDRIKTNYCPNCGARMDLEV